ncbi:MAG: VWA domain-containing protein [Verrucomicrobia bacterium]|nr:VWA domain-containing protein [Verrucomicrobiota bacterium]
MIAPMHSPTIEILPLKKGFLRAAAEATHVLVRLVAPAQPTTENVAAAQRAPLDLALVIDRSGSMSGDPLKAALESTVRIIQGLRPDDRVSVVAFDDKVNVVQPLVAVGDAQDLVNRVRHIDSGGSTALFDGWQEGVKQLAPFVKKERIARVILLTDGQANHGLVEEGKIFEHVAKAAGAGITTSTVGLGHGFNESLLTGMAKAGEGAANFGQTADDLNEAFEEQFAILSNAFLRQVKVSIQGGSDVQARLLGELLEDGVTLSRKLGTLPWDSALTAVVELKIGANAKADSLLAVNFSAVTKDGTAITFGPQILALPEVDLAAFSTLQPDVHIAAAVSEAVTAEKLDTIEALVRNGQEAEAKQKLAELSQQTDLSPWAREKVAYLTRLLDEDRIMAMKELRYASRNFTRSIKASCVAENSADFDEEVEQAKALFLRKKRAAGRSSAPQPPQTPPQA